MSDVDTEPAAGHPEGALFDKESGFRAEPGRMTALVSGEPHDAT